MIATAPIIGGWVPDCPDARPRVRVSALTPDPENETIFRAPDPAAYDDRVLHVAESLRVDGQQHPVLYRVDGTIIAGHKRVLAAQQCGWEWVWAEVRHFRTAQAALDYLITDNFNRQTPVFGVRRAVYEKIAPWMLKGERVSVGDLEALGRRLRVSVTTLRRDFERLHAPARRKITPEELQLAWQTGRTGMMLSVVPVAGTHHWVIRVTLRNETIHQAGPAPYERAARMSLKMARSTIFRDKVTPPEQLAAGTALRQLRESLKWTQVETAAALGLSQNYLSELEGGRYRAHNAHRVRENLKKLARERQ